MVYFSQNFFIIFFNLFLFLVSNCTTFFTYIVSLNFIDMNTVFLLIIMVSLTYIKNFFYVIITVIFFFTTFTKLVIFKKLITQLIVGTVVIHPILFYFFLVICVFKLYSHSQVSLMYQKICTTYTIIFFLGVTLTLGGFWATQSTSWGYFWVNDLIEWSLFIIILTLIIFLHIWYLSKISLNFFFTPIMLLNIILLIRLGFFSTRHNFIGLNFLIYNIYILYFLIFVLLSKVSGRTWFWSKSLWLVFFFVFGLYQLELVFIKFFSVIYILNYICFSNQFTKNLYLHFVYLFFLMCWVLPFFFFFMVLKFHIYGSVHLWLIFPNIIFNNLTYYEFFDNLTFIDFFSYSAVYTTLLNASNSALVVLNNFHLIYILNVLFFLRKMGWT